jgi:hypothetical protein
MIYVLARHHGHHSGLNHLSVLWHHLFASPAGPWLLVAAVVALIALYISR